MRTEPNSDAAAAYIVDAVANQMWVVDSIACSFDAAPDFGPFVLVIIGGTVMWRNRIKRAGPYRFVFPGGLCRGVLNERLLVSLATGGAGRTGVVSFTYR